MTDAARCPDCGGAPSPGMILCSACRRPDAAPVFPSGAEPPWGREKWENATVEEMREYLDQIGPPWGNSKLLASWVIECFWIAYEALNRLEVETDG